MAKHCAGIIQRGPRKGHVKADYRKQPGDRCPVKLSARKTKRRRAAKSCRDIAEKAYKAGLLKGRKLQAEHKPTPKSVPATQAMLLGAGLGRARRRRRRRRMN